MNTKLKIVTLFILFTVMVAGTQCSKDPSPIPVFEDTPYIIDHGDLPPPKLPVDNALTQSKVRLGRMLFYEKSLSKDGSQACGDCHQQEFGFSDPRQFSIGVAGLPGKRHSMSVFNVAWHKNGFFWDGRSPTLRHQALQPIQDPLEMDETIARVIEKLNAQKSYKDQFIRAFGDDVITEARIGLALEAFMMTIVSHDSKYDRFLKGQVTLTEEEERGRQIFFQEFDPKGIKKGGECFHCHGGFNLTNDQFMNNGLDTDAMMADFGLMNVTGLPSDKGKFKVPSLRQITLTAPYMHDGRFATLEEVIRHYNTDVKHSNTVDFLLQYNLQPGGLKLNDQDISDLVAFLHTFTDPSLATNPAYKKL